MNGHVLSVLSNVPVIYIIGSDHPNIVLVLSQFILGHHPVP